MKKFNFSLEKILQFKNQALDNLKFDLSNLQYQLAAKTNEIEELKKKYTDTDNAYREKTIKSIQPYEIQYYKNYLDMIVKDIEKKLEEKIKIIKKIEIKKEEIVSMNKEISTLDKLKEKKVEQYKKDLLKSEEALIDEFVNNSNIVTINH